jgi:hypothetical protein
MAVAAPRARAAAGALPAPSLPRTAPRARPRERARTRPALTRWVLWIAVVGALLAGIVALNVAVLRLAWSGSAQSGIVELAPRTRSCQAELSTAQPSAGSNIAPGSSNRRPFGTPPALERRPGEPVTRLRRASACSVLFATVFAVALAPRLRPSRAGLERLASISRPRRSRCRPTAARFSTGWAWARNQREATTVCEPGRSGPRGWPVIARDLDLNPAEVRAAVRPLARVRLRRSQGGLAEAKCSGPQHRRLLLRGRRASIRRAASAPPSSNAGTDNKGSEPGCAGNVSGETGEAIRDPFRRLLDVADASGSRGRDVTLTLDYRLQAQVKVIGTRALGGMRPWPRS